MKSSGGKMDFFAKVRKCLRPVKGVGSKDFSVIKYLLGFGTQNF